MQDDDNNTKQRRIKDSTSGECGLRQIKRGRDLISGENVTKLDPVLVVRTRSLKIQGITESGWRRKEHRRESRYESGCKVKAVKTKTAC